jgi:hypothetical protein
VTVAVKRPGRSNPPGRFDLLTRGGQGRGRTADLPLFREPHYTALTRQGVIPREDLGA